MTGRKHIQRILLVLDKPNRPQTALKRALRVFHDARHAVSLEPVSFLHSNIADSGLAFDPKERSAIKKTLIQQRKEWVRDLQVQHCELKPIRVLWEHDLAGWIQNNSDQFDLVIKTAGGSRGVRSASDWALLNSCPTDLLLVGHRKVRQPRCILVALDLDHSDRVHSQLNKTALERGTQMAELSEAELHTASAVEVSPALVDLDIVNERSAVRRVAARTKDVLDKMLAPYKIPKSQRHFPVGRIGQAMADCAKAVKADLLVVGTRARPIAQTLGLGNSAQRILRKAPCDILAVRPS
ncbi:MAG: universal stress protein [Pseudomonadota bacterium]